MKRVEWYIFTPHGAFPQEGETAKIALARFLRVYPKWDVLGIMREDLVVKPSTESGGTPFLCMFIQGKLLPKPNPEDGHQGGQK